MLWIVAVVLVSLWLAILVAAYPLGGYVHLLLGVAVIAALAQLVRKQRKSRQVNP